MTTASIIGFTAGTLTIVSFAPQAVKAYITKKTRDISLLTFIIVTIEVMLWLTYGIMVKDYPIIFANFFTLCMSVSIIIMKLIYDKKI